MTSLAWALSGVASLIQRPQASKPAKREIEACERRAPGRAGSTGLARGSLKWHAVPAMRAVCVPCLAPHPSLPTCLLAPATARIKLVLPTPEAPTMSKLWPGASVKLRSLATCSRAVGKQHTSGCPGLLQCPGMRNATPCTRASRRAGYVSGSDDNQV